MNFMNRAWLYIVRKRGKSILLFVILLVMATFVLTALALGNASKSAQQDLRQSLGGSFLIGFDYTENNPYLKVESVDGGTLMYSTQQISPELVGQIREIEGIKECSATVEGLAAFPSLKLFTGNIPIEEEFRESSKILSTWKSEELTRFTSGQLTLTEGRHILPDDKNKGLISKALAEKNGLKIGDKIQTDRGVEIEIVGLFSPKEIEGINDQVTTYDKIQNLIITDLATLVAYENGPAIQGFNELTVSVDDPQNMEKIISAVKEIAGVDWKGFSFLIDNEDYENAAFSLEQLSELVSTVLIVALIVSTGRHCCRIAYCSPGGSVSGKKSFKCFTSGGGFRQCQCFAASPQSRKYKMAEGRNLAGDSSCKIQPQELCFNGSLFWP